MELSLILQLVGSVGFPGAILILLIFLANKHLPAFIENFSGIKIELALLNSSVNRLISRMDDPSD